ncbi:MAG: hypothetical protein ACE14V_00445 [bacterium]
MKSQIIFGLFILSMVIGISLASAQDFIPTGKILVIKASEDICITENVIIAKGIGKPPSYAISSTQSKLMARRAAIVVAQRNLAIVVGKVVKQTRGTVSRTRVKAFLRGAKVREVRELDNGWMEATLELPINGKPSLAATLGYDKIVMK